MSVLPIYLDGTEPLRKKALEVKEVTDETIKLIMDMFDTMHSADGIGLAANQVGVMQRIIVVDISCLDDYKETKPITFINPEVVYEYGKCTMEEGCLSVPDVRAEVIRPQKIRVRYLDTDFKVQEIEASDIFARVILHEIDHLNGRLFIDYLSRSKKKELIDRLEKIQNGDIETKYPIISNQNVRL